MNERRTKLRRVDALRISMALGMTIVASGCSPSDDREETSSLASPLTSFDRPVLQVTDTNADPHVFEADLTVDEQDVTLNGTTVHALVYKDANQAGAYAGTPAGIPVPQIVVDVGDEVIVTLTNDLAEDCAAVACNTSIHWHGTELDNDSDGTGVTQNRVEPGESYTYRFYPPRPGVFWFHPHMMPGAQVFAGVYGALIVRDPNESALQDGGAIPPEDSTHTIVLSDTEFDADGDVGFVDDDTGEAEPWQDLAEACATSADCSPINQGEGDVVLVNGASPADGVPVIKAKSGSGVRLRLANTATDRYFVLHVDGNDGDDNLYRIGGEGGFLEAVRLEGGIQGSWDTKYDEGEILVPASGRSDVVIVPTGSNGDIITISGQAFDRRSQPFDPTGDLLHIQIDDSLSGASFSIAEGDPILGAGAIDDLKVVTITDVYQDPVPALPGPGSGEGTADDTWVLEGLGPGQTAINGVQGHFESSGDDYTQVPYQGATRYALTGDTLEFTIQNDTFGHHPFHHHGFSFQPIRLIETETGTVVYEYDYPEFVDVIDVPDDHSMVVRMHLEDRPRITDDRQEAGAPAPDQFFASGGAAGRWVAHCHLFLHAATGMISELVVLDTDRDGDGFDTSEDCDDLNPEVPMDVELCDDGVDNDCNGAVDEEGCNHAPEANAGPDRTIECSEAGGAVVTLDGTASSDLDGDALTYAWSAPGIVFDDPTSATPTAFFPLGTTTVTLTVSDLYAADTDEVDVTVADTTAPELGVSIDPIALWPPNHQYVDFESTVIVTDVCDPSPTFVLSSASSNEADNGTADGNTTEDILGVEEGTADVSFQLRAERSARGSGRLYSIEYTATDASGNEATSSVDVSVPLHP